MNTDNNRNVVAAVSYLLFFITGVTVYFVEREDKFIRFHALQSIVVFGALFLLNLIVSVVVSPLPFIGFIAKIFNTLFLLVIFIVWIVSMIQAYKGKIFKWPIVGNFVEKKIRGGISN